MRYLGGKSRIAKNITEFLTSVRKPGQVFVEPFLGGCNVLPLMTDPKIACDTNKDIIMLYNALQQGWVPPSEITHSEYVTLRNSPSSPLRGFAGIACSYAGKWFGGYARSGNRNYALNSKNTALRTAPLISNALIIECSYLEINLPPASLIYCDPPYKNTTKYKGSFDHDKFWDWARVVSKSHDVYVSEYAAPSDFTCVWSIQRNLEMAPGTRIEKIFRHT